MFGASLKALEKISLKKEGLPRRTQKDVGQKDRQKYACKAM
jgi:hypothetical protein